MADYAIFRVQKLMRGQGKHSVYASLRHLQNHDKTADISHPEKTAYNRTYLAKGFDIDHPAKMINKAVSRHNKNSIRALRKDAAVAVEMIFSYSPKAKNLQWIEEYEKKIQDFLKTEFPTFQVIRLDRHCDENSVHWHVVGVPFAKDRKRISAKEVLGGPAEMVRHQDRFAEAVAGLGLKRGISKKKTKKRHTTKTEWQRQQEIEKEAKKALDSVLGEDR